MSCTLLHFHWHNGHATENLGALSFITLRHAVPGDGHAASVDIHFKNGVLEMPSTQLIDFVARAQAALALQREADCSGAVADLEDGET